MSSSRSAFALSLVNATVEDFAIDCHPTTHPFATDIVRVFCLASRGRVFLSVAVAAWMFIRGCLIVVVVDCRGDHTVQNCDSKRNETTSARRTRDSSGVSSVGSAPPRQHCDSMTSRTALFSFINRQFVFLHSKVVHFSVVECNQCTDLRSRSSEN